MHARRRSRWLLRLGVAWLAATGLACGLGDTIREAAREQAEEEIREAIEEAASEGAGVEIGSPGGHVAAQSRTPECRADLRAALERFKTEQGLGYTVEDTHVESLLDTGAVALSYVRDGVTTTIHYAVDGREGGCQVVYHERETREPGHYQQYFNRFSVPLAVCRCDPQ